jgi:hypothetical protein
MTKDTTTLFLPKGHLEAIGAIAAQWSLLELLVGECILAVANLHHNIGRSIIAQMGIIQRLDALLSLVNETIPDTELARQIVQINDIIRYEREGKPSLQTKRNRIVHTYWEARTSSSPDKDDVALSFSIRARGKLRTILTAVHVSELRQIAAEIDHMNGHLDDWLVRFTKARGRAP